MSFTSALKRSLGFEETEEESKNRKNNENSFSIGSIIDALKRPTENNSSNNQQQSSGEGGIRTHGPLRSHWFSRPAP